jgi:hypothetical protein
MPNSAGVINPFFAGGGTVKAWGVYGLNATDQTTMTLRNVVNCYNLNFDDALFSTQITATGITVLGRATGAIPFRFVTPMVNTKYKIFVSPKIVSTQYASGGRVLFAHALNSSKYPKTVNGFWVRLGILTNEGDGTLPTTTPTNTAPLVGEILNESTFPYTYQIQVMVV